MQHWTLKVRFTLHIDNVHQISKHSAGTLGYKYKPAKVKKVQNFQATRGTIRKGLKGKLRKDTNIIFYVIACPLPNNPPPVAPWPKARQAILLCRFLDHTQRRTTFCRIPIDEWLARRRDSFLTTHKHDWPPRDSKPQSSRRATIDLHLRTHGHWDRTWG